MGRNTNPDQKNRQTNKPDVELTERQFKVLDVIKTKEPETHAEAHRQFNDMHRMDLSYTQVRTTIKNLKEKDMLVNETPYSGEVWTVTGGEVWESIVMVLTSSVEEKPVEQVEEQNSSYKVWI